MVNVRALRGRTPKKAESIADSGSTSSSVGRRPRNRPQAKVRKRVVLVSANPSTAASYKAMLSPACEVEVVESSAAALELLLVDRSIRLVLCESELQDANACEFLLNLSWIVPGECPPVLVVGEIAAPDALRAMQLGAAQCVSLREGPQALLHEVEQLLLAPLAPRHSGSRIVASRVR